ncbi:MAG: cation diffusion facilitator family transporter, partial [Gammaproteobacteria bacterium]|nr:cation diffusion facilitator family transporter [Gammaproteobacteria bacterium]MBU1556512.1 cation diffusion facilitator family transporter [Gammaproteobacteria bacterium]
HSWLDSVVAIAVALHILHEGGNILYRSINGLLDKSLSDDKINSISQCLAAIAGPDVTFNRLRTRAAASLQFAQVDMLVPAHWSVAQAHKLADDAELAVQALGVELIVHIEPKFTP